MYIGDDDTFDRAIERFAVAYADQNDADYAAFTEAAEKHRIEVNAAFSEHWPVCPPPRMIGAA